MTVQHTDPAGDPISGAAAAAAHGITGPILSKKWTEGMPWSLNPACPCQWGICGACDGTESGYGQDRHDRCVTRMHLKRYDGPPVIHDSLTYKGFCKAPILTGCRYVCPCECWKDSAMAAPPPRRITRPVPAPDPVMEGQSSLLDQLEATR